MSSIANLKKAFQTRVITKDTHSLQDFVAINKNDNKIARMEVIGLETKYIPQFDSANPHAKADAQGNGFRTRFILKDGSTIGTFSMGAYNFFRFFAELMGYKEESNFLHIDIQGVIQVDISVLALDAKRSTYNFDLVEEGSEVQGFSDYLPTVENVLQLNVPTEPEAEQEATTKK